MDLSSIVLDESAFTNDRRLSVQTTCSTVSTANSPQPISPRQSRSVSPLGSRPLTADSLDDDDTADRGDNRRPSSSPSSFKPQPKHGSVLKSRSSNRKSAHILSEQRRRETINDGFVELKSTIPHCNGTQDSKAVILRKAVHYISSLESRIERLESELFARQAHPLTPQYRGDTRDQLAQPPPPTSVVGMPVSHVQLVNLPGPIPAPRHMSIPVPTPTGLHPAAPPPLRPPTPLHGQTYQPYTIPVTVSVPIDQYYQYSQQPPPQVYYPLVPPKTDTRTVPSAV
ncbi:hypothetical protein V1512DRAFT_261102 [Lipomyces arxii]|uniref:uncharacterized protein n=1 Tax=Lipomyces arxii TaxID=56418 RepID=UPI0034CD9C7E